MDQKPRCQSCGMPLGEPGGYGTNADGSENQSYCKFCFQNGSFINPDMTFPEMIESSVKFMTENLGYNEDEAHGMSNAIIPKLERWNKV